MPKKHAKQLPFVSVCTPTYNRRPFIPIAIQCFQHQTYPQDRMEWIIVDDGTDSVEDLVSHIPNVKYYRIDEKMTLGQKRNFMNRKTIGDILVYMDDDDYYPPERVAHAVASLSKTKALCAGSSAMFIYFNHIQKMYQFGPYGPNHATAATFAFKRELLTRTRFDENSSVAEEKTFLKEYTIPFVQLDPMKTIVVFSHSQNSFDKKELLKSLPNPTIHETHITPADIVKEPAIYKFFMDDLEDVLAEYNPGSKPDVERQIKKLTEERMRKQQEMIETQQLLKSINQNFQMNNNNNISDNNVKSENKDNKQNKSNQNIMEKSEDKTNNSMAFVQEIQRLRHENSELHSKCQSLETQCATLKEQLEHVNARFRELLVKKSTST